MQPRHADDDVRSLRFESFQLMMFCTVLSEDGQSLAMEA